VLACRSWDRSYASRRLGESSSLPCSVTGYLAGRPPPIGDSAREIALEKRVGSRQSVGIELGACSQASGARRAKGEEHENCERAFGCTFGGAIGNSVGIASRGGKRTKERSQFKVHLTGSKAISASSPEDEKSYRVIQSLHDCCRLPSVRSAAFGIASEERKSRLLLLLRPASPSSPCASVRINTRHPMFGEARDRGGIFGDIGRFRATETALAGASGGKATESQRLFRTRQETVFARDCVVADALHRNRSPTQIPC
jgi:hypothetical protein